MRKFALLGLCIIITLSGTQEAYAQFNRKSIKSGNKRMASYRGGKSRFGKQRQYNAIGFSVSSLNYYGDLSPSANKLSTDISFSRPGFALSYARRLGPRFTLQGQFMFGTIRGSDQESANKGDPSNGIYRYQRNLSF